MPVVNKNVIHRGNAIDLSDVQPIILRVETEVQSNADAEVQSLALMNPTGEPVEIRELKFTCRPKPNVPYVGENFVGEAVGVGDGLTTNFTHIAAHLPITPNSVSILVAGVVVGADNGAGLIVGGNLAGTSTIDYVTGAVNLDFIIAPAAAEAITMSYTQSLGLTSSFVSGGLIGVSLRVAGKPITNGPIPLWSFGSAYTLGLEELGIVPSFILSPQQVLTIGGHYRFKLDEPMYLPPGVAIEATIRSFGGFAQNAIVSIVASGSVLPHRPTPTKIKVPWVCVYNSRSFEMTEKGGDESAETALINPFDKPVTIRRFVGRIAQISNNTTTGRVVVSDCQNIFGQGANAGTEGYYNTVFKIRMRDSSGAPVVRGATPFRNVFDAKTRAWETNFKLPARQYYKVQVEKDALAGVEYAPFDANTGLPVPSTSRAQVQVSFIGWREESL